MHFFRTITAILLNFELLSNSLIILVDVLGIELPCLHWERIKYIIKGKENGCT